MADVKVINAQPEDASETSYTSSGNEIPLIPHERNRFLETFLVVIALMVIWSIALLPAIFYANKKPAPAMEPPGQVNKR